MNMEFLYNYEKDEIARQEQHYEKVSKGQIEPTGYPDNTRFTSGFISGGSDDCVLQDLVGN
jgi:hypothetical protein